jgi:hypothetical protein
MKQLKKDPVHRKIMHTTEATVDMRKFLIKRLLKGHKFDEENDDDD